MRTLHLPAYVHGSEPPTSKLCGIVTAPTLFQLAGNTVPRKVPSLEVGLAESPRACTFLLAGQAVREMIRLPLDKQTTVRALPPR